MATLQDRYNYLNKSFTVSGGTGSYTISDDYKNYVYIGNLAGAPFYKEIPQEEKDEDKILKQIFTPIKYI